MTKYIDAEKLKRFVESIGLTPQKSADYNDGRDDVKMVVLDFIDSLQQEQPEVDLEEVARLYADNQIPTDYPDYFCRQDIKDAFIAGAKWMESQMPMPEDTVIFMKGVAEGRRLEREDRNDDNLPRYYGD